MVSIETRAMILSTFAKFSFGFPELKERIQTIYRANNIFKSAHVEIQQRGNEYFNLTTVANPEVMPQVLKEMPVYEEKDSGILNKLDKSKNTTDKLGGSRGQASGGLAAVGGDGAAPPPGAAPLTNLDLLPVFKTADEGKLYENPALQIGAKLEFSAHHARITLYYGNKHDSEPMTGCTTRLYSPEDEAGLILNAQELPPTLQPKAQVPQMLSLECRSAFETMPLLDLTFSFQGNPIIMRLTIPISLNKFMAPLPTPLDQAAFGAKWAQIGANPACEVVVNCSPDGAFTRDTLVAALAAMKFAVCPDIDLNPANVVCGCLLHTGEGVVGVLVRVEPDVAASTIKFTVRASNPAAAVALGSILHTVL
jgi:AP-2 complex subunit alpha